MSKNEFLESLSSQLSGQMQEGRIAAHVQYYRSYIEEQCAEGRTEQEVTAQMGDPRLIAKTLLDTDEASGHDVYESSGGYGAYGQDPGEQEPRVRKRSYHLDFSTWYGKLIVIVGAALVIAGLVIVASAVIPFFIIFGIIVYILSRLRRR